VLTLSPRFAATWRDVKFGRLLLGELGSEGLLDELAGLLAFGASEAFVRIVVSPRAEMTTSMTSSIPPWISGLG